LFAYSFSLLFQEEYGFAKYKSAISFFEISSCSANSELLPDVLEYKEFLQANGILMVAFARLIADLPKSIFSSIVNLFFVQLLSIWRLLRNKSKREPGFLAVLFFKGVIKQPIFDVTTP
jgi:hypothetical protein